MGFRRSFRILCTIFFVLSGCSRSTATAVIEPASLAAATQGQSYSQKLTVKADTPAFLLQITDGTLPAGLTLDEDPESETFGLISGVPTESGRFSVTVYAACLGTSVSGAEGIISYELLVNR